MKKISIIISIITILIITGCVKTGVEAKWNIVEEDVMNGTKTEVLGKTAYIETKKEEFKKTSDEDYSALMDYISKKDYNWFVIAFEDKTGLYCSKSLCLYQQLKTDDNVNKYISGMDVYGSIIKNDETQKYEYNDYSNKE